MSEQENKRLCCNECNGENLKWMTFGSSLLIDMNLTMGWATYETEKDEVLCNDCDKSVEVSIKQGGDRFVTEEELTNMLDDKDGYLHEQTNRTN